MKFRIICGKILSKATGNLEHLNNAYRHYGVKIGKKCIICSDLTGGEPFLINIGDNCIVSTNVTLITHDMSISRMCDKSCVYGRVTIGNNCFIGNGSTILPGVKLCDNVIVAANSVVTKSISESNVIVGGNPAKVLSTWDVYYKKNIDYAINECDFYSLKDKEHFLKNR